MRVGDLVSKLERWHNAGRVRYYIRYCIVLNVTKQHLKNGINAYKPGLHLFRGYWYSNRPFEIESFGKIEGRADDGDGKVIGRIRNHQQMRMLHKLGKFD